jgi:hypothetical protein
MTVVHTYFYIVELFSLWISQRIFLPIALINSAWIWSVSSDLCLWSVPGDLCLRSVPGDLCLWSVPGDLCLWSVPGDLCLFRFSDCHQSYLPVWDTVSHCIIPVMPCDHSDLSAALGWLDNSYVVLSATEMHQLYIYLPVGIRYTVLWTEVATLHRYLLPPSSGCSNIVISEK